MRRLRKLRKCAKTFSTLLRIHAGAKRMGLHSNLAYPMVARWVLERVLHKWPELRRRMAVRLQRAWRGNLARMRMGKWYLLRLRHVYHIAKVDLLLS